MHWQAKGAVQKALGCMPFGERPHYELQKRAGGLPMFEHELTGKIEDWRLMAGHLRSAGVRVTGTRFLEMSPARTRGCRSVSTSAVQRLATLAVAYFGRPRAR